MDDEYAAFAGGKLKIKKVGDGVEAASKKKKKKNKEKRKLEERGPKIASEAAEAERERVIREEEELHDPRPAEKGYERRYTKAELAYKKQQEKMQDERITNKAMKTHKQRVEEFNRHLDNLTEHFDIPKVSWTK